MRATAHAFIGHHASTERLEHVAETLESVVAELSQGEPRSRAGDTDDRSRVPEIGEVLISYDERPISGRSAPWGVDLHVTNEVDGVVGRCTLRSAHEGAPGRAHGGVVAAVFDDLFGFVMQRHNMHGFTGEITVRYRAGTPLHVPLEYRARLDRVDGRKIFLEAESFHGDTLLATSRATFIRMESLNHPPTAGA